VEVPPQRGPQHHGDLSRGTARGPEVIGGRVGDGGNEEMIVAEARSPEPVDVVFLQHAWHFGPGRRVGVCLRVRGGGRLWHVIFLVIFAVEDDGPAGREDVVVEVEVVGFEVQPAKDGRDREGLAVRQMYGRGCHECRLPVEYNRLLFVRMRNVVVDLVVVIAVNVIVGCR